MGAWCLSRNSSCYGAVNMDKSLHGQRLSEKTKDEKTGNILLDGRPPFMNRVGTAHQLRCGVRCTPWYGTTFVKCYISIFVSLFIWRLIAWAASTMNQSDIRGLSCSTRTEPTLIFFVASFAFYGHEFSPSQTNLSYRMAASSSVVPTLSSIMKSLSKS